MTIFSSPVPPKLADYYEPWTYNYQTLIDAPLGDDFPVLVGSLGRILTGTLPVAGVYSGLMNLDDVDLPDAALFYLCGPLPFMTALRSALLARQVPACDIQYEVFGPDLWQADAETRPVHGSRRIRGERFVDGRSLSMTD